MDILQTIDEHMIIRETVGYDTIKQVEVWDLPNVMQFLKIVWNYNKISQLDERISS